MNRNRMIAAVHTAARAQRLDDAARRDMMQTTTGKRSCADMNLKELAAILDHLNNRHGRMMLLPSDADDRQRLTGKITRQLTQASLPDAYADGIAKKMFGQPIKACKLDQLRKVIAALSYHLKRVQKRP